jgi:hypothetical protein
MRDMDREFGKFICEPRPYSNFPGYDSLRRNLHLGR